MGPLKKVFIVHSSKDKKIGQMLYEALINMGLKNEQIFYSSIIENGHQLGNDFISLSKEAMHDCDLVIVLISRNIYNSFYCQNELGAAWILNKKILPIIIDNTNIGFLGFLQDHIFIKWNSSLNTSKQILKNLNLNLGIEFNDNNLFLLENIRKYLKYQYAKPSLEDFSTFDNIRQKEKEVIEKKLRKSKKLFLKTQSLENRLNEIFNSKIFEKALFDSCGYDFCYNLVVHKIASILLYYLYTRDDRISYSILFKIMNDVNLENNFISKELIYSGLKYINNTNDEKILTKKLIENTIYKGYVTHAFNPAYLDSISKNGLGSNCNQQFEKNLKDLEKAIYSNKFLNRQEYATFYYSFPSANSIHYACSLAPEKVFGGPLKQLNKYIKFDDDINVENMLPVIVGQNLKNYYKRISNNNIKLITQTNSNFNYTIKKILKRKMNQLINDFCYDYSYLFLIPIKNKNKDILDCYNSSVEKIFNLQTFNDYLSKYSYNKGFKLQNITNFDHAYSFLGCITPNKIGVLDESLMSNLCSSKILKINSNVLKIKIPVYYKLLQNYCKHHYLLGTKIITELSAYYKSPLYRIEKIRHKKN